MHLRSLIAVTILFCLSFSWRVAGAPSELRQTPAANLSRNPGSNHVWTETVSESGKASTVRIEGKVDGTGLTAISLVLTNRTIESYLIGNKAYVTSAQRNWKSEPLLAKGESPGALMTRLVRSVTPPSQEIDLLLSDKEKIKKNGDVFSGDLPESVAKKLFEGSERRSGKAEAAERKAVRKEANAARGNVTLWTKEGVVTKYEIRLNGKIDIDGKETEIVRTRTIEIKDIGTTKIEVPEKARRKLGI